MTAVFSCGGEVTVVMGVTEVWLMMAAVPMFGENTGMSVLVTGEGGGVCQPRW